MDLAQQRSRLISQLRQQGYLTREDVAQVMSEVPRENFVDRSQVAESAIYSDKPLSSGKGQTISAPHMVAWQTCLLNLRPQDKVLEVGTGLGYQAAILSRLAGQVISLEVVPELAAEAENNLEDYKKVKVVKGDGGRGYLQEALYDKILITCAIPQLPLPLKQQLKQDGLIVAPIGDRHSQQLKSWRKQAGGFSQEDHGAVRFVPLRGEFGFKD